MKILICLTVTIENCNFSYTVFLRVYTAINVEYVEQSKLKNACYQTNIAVAKCFIKMFTAATLHTTHKLNAEHNCFNLRK